MATVGSEAWINNTCYEVGSELHERVIKFLATVEWTALTALASKARQGIACKLSEKYSIGHFNMVKQVVFEDGVLWIVRLRFPTFESFGAREALSPERTMESEVATMNYLNKHTAIPVPTVFGHDCDPNNVVGAPFIFMSYIHGSVADELRTSEQARAGVFGTPTQDKRFRQQMARIQVELATHTFDRIGSIFHDGNSFTVGPDVETGLGPFDNSSQYYATVIRHLKAVATAEAEPEVLEGASFNFLDLFPDLADLYGLHEPFGPFRVANLDFGAHNLLVNEEFEVVGVIDFDGVMAAPKELVARFPTLTGLDRDPPGHAPRNEHEARRMRISAPYLDEYQGMVRDAVTRMNAAKPTSQDGSRIEDMAELMTSDIGSIVQGLYEFRTHQREVNDEWLRAYERLRQKKAEKQHDIALARGSVRSD